MVLVQYNEWEGKTEVQNIASSYLFSGGRSILVRRRYEGFPRTLILVWHPPCGPSCIWQSAACAVCWPPSVHFGAADLVLCQKLKQRAGLIITLNRTLKGGILMTFFPLPGTVGNALQSTLSKTEQAEMPLRFSSGRY